jgi:fluoroacetyl-CoA thioesterase
MSLPGLKIGLCQSETLTVSEALSVPAQARHFDSLTEMPPVFATAQLIAFVEWTCVHALAPHLGPDQRTVGTRV